MAGKQSKSGKDSGKDLAGGSSSPASSGGVQACKGTANHWIGVRVVDEDGKVVKDVAVHGKLDDGSALTVDLSTAALEKDGTFRTTKTLCAGSCEFTFPALFNAEWWPQGGSAGTVTTASTAAAADGDCVVSMADAVNFRNYHSIWDQAANNDFKKDRPNPNMLAKGDTLKAPDKKDKVEKKAMDAVWTFVVKNKKPFTVRIVLVDKDDKPLSGKTWELKTPISLKGTTAANGLIELKGLKPADKSGSLAVVMSPAGKAPAKPKPAKPVTPPPYPPPIVAADFVDKMPAPDFSAQNAEWDLKLGGLPAVKVKEGVLARLHNLGFGCDIDSDEKTTTRMVKAYQRFYLKNDNGSGKTEDIQDDAATRHDKA